MASARRFHTPQVSLFPIASGRCLVCSPCPCRLPFRHSKIRPPGLPCGPSVPALFASCPHFCPLLDVHDYGAYLWTKERREQQCLWQIQARIKIGLPWPDFARSTFVATFPSSTSVRHHHAPLLFTVMQGLWSSCH